MGVQYGRVLTVTIVETLQSSGITSRSLAPGHRKVRVDIGQAAALGHHGPGLAFHQAGRLDVIVEGRVLDRRVQLGQVVVLSDAASPRLRHGLDCVSAVGTNDVCCNSYGSLSTLLCSSNVQKIKSGSFCSLTLFLRLG